MLKIFLYFAINGKKDWKLRVKEAADIWGISARRIMKLCEEGRILGKE